MALSSKRSTPVSESRRDRLVRRLSWGLRDRWPDREVTREVQGVSMVLPWAHRLPDYARAVPSYGQNLVELARRLDPDGEGLTVIDVGANVGDSTLQILDAVEGRIVCVEADRHFLHYLHRNVDDDPRISVVEALLVRDAGTGTFAPVRSGGTTRFEPGSSTMTAETLTVSQLRASQPDLEAVRLVKSDTDGYDVDLVPAIAAQWSASRPVLFLEYDHVLSRRVGNDPVSLWPQVAALGYERVAAWDNLGAPVGNWTVAEVTGHVDALDDVPRRGAHQYWDVAIVHRDDAVGMRAIDALVPRGAAT